MKSTPRFIFSRILLTIVAVLVGWFSAFSTPAMAQGSQGQNAVYNSSGTVVGSSSFIDASTFVGNVGGSPNVCSVLNYVLTHGFPATGAVIDARGLNSVNTSMTCTSSPWSGTSSPSTILLPAGTITIPGTWTLPSYTKLIGEGYGTTGGTVIQACTSSICPANFATGTPMIQFGPSCPINPPACATAISVENLMLNGNNLNITGIQNPAADELTYVDHVTLFQIWGTGLAS